MYHATVALHVRLARLEREVELDSSGAFRYTHCQVAEFRRSTLHPARATHAQRTAQDIRGGYDMPPRPHTEFAPGHVRKELLAHKLHGLHCAPDEDYRPRLLHDIAVPQALKQPVHPCQRAALTSSRRSL